MGFHYTGISVPVPGSAALSSNRRHSRSSVSQADRRLFREWVGPVKRLTPERRPGSRPRPAPVPRFRQADDRSVLVDALADAWEPTDLETGDELWFARAGLQRRLLQKLRRGRFVVQAEYDLHGLGATEARRALAAFLDRARRQGWRCVRIIHGKGLRSRHGRPVLKSRIGYWLRQRDEVLAFCSARPVDGGTGALYVLLKRG